MHLGATGSAGDEPGSADGTPPASLGAQATSLRAPVRSLRAPATSLGAPAPSLGAPRITVEQSGKNNTFFGNAVGAPGNHSYYISFNDC